MATPPDSVSFSERPKARVRICVRILEGRSETIGGRSPGIVSTPGFPAMVPRGPPTCLGISAPSKVRQNPVFRLTVTAFSLGQVGPSDTNGAS